MRTYTDTQRLDFILQLMKENIGIECITRHAGPNDPIDRSLIDSEMHQIDEARERSRTEKRHALLRQKEDIDRQLSALNSQS